MRSNRRRDTKPELAIRRLLHARGLRYRVDVPLEFDHRRRADIVFPAAKLIVFIDGCFWHGCPTHSVPAKHNTGWWREKILANKQRDHSTDEALLGAGWKVVRVWEHQPVAEQVAAVLEALQWRRS